MTMIDVKPTLMVNIDATTAGEILRRLTAQAMKIAVEGEIARRNGDLRELARAEHAEGVFEEILGEELYEKVTASALALFVKALEAEDDNG